MTYWANVPSPALSGGPAPKRRAGLIRPSSWRAPVELVLATTRSVGADVVRQAYEAGVEVAGAAAVTLHDGRYYATVRYGDGHVVFLPLNVWAVESRR